MPSRALRERLARIGPISDGYHLARELWWMAWDTPARARARFEREFAAGCDPWDYAGPLARERHAHALGLLDAAGLRAVDRALEVGCAEGHFSALLAPRCRALLVVDVSPLALARARERCRAAPGLRFAEWDLRRDPLPGRFDLVVAMDVLESFCRPDRVRAARARLVQALAPGGHLLLGNSRQGALFETSWWGRALIRGGRWIDRYVASHPALEVVGTGVGGFYVNSLFPAASVTALARVLGGGLAPGLPRSLVDLAAAGLNRSPLRLALDRARYGRLGWYVWQSRRVLGWTRGGEAVALARHAYLLPDAPTIVEVGSFLGCATVLLAGARRLRGSGRVHAVDPFDGSGEAYSAPFYRAIAERGVTTLQARFEANLRRAGVRAWVEVHRGGAEGVAAGWLAPVDMLFLDGDQSPAGARAGYLAWAPHLRPGAIVAVHNSIATEPDHDGSLRLVEELIRPPAYRDVDRVGSTTFARLVRLPSPTVDRPDRALRGPG